MKVLQKRVVCTNFYVYIFISPNLKITQYTQTLTKEGENMPVLVILGAVDYTTKVTLYSTNLT